MKIDPNGATELQAESIIEEVRFSMEELTLEEAIDLTDMVIEGLRADLAAMNDDLRSR